jgi:hypothetical protein
MTRQSLLALPALFLTGCVSDLAPPGEIKTERTALDIGDAKDLEASIDFPAGEIALSGGGKKLLEADYTFSSDRFKPTFDLQRNNGRATLNVGVKPKASGNGQNIRWEMRLADSLPTAIVFHMGAGKAQLDLGSLDLRSLRLNLGVGELTLDLRGRPKSSYDVEVNGGVGKCLVYLPGGSVHAEAYGGIGKIDVQGRFKRDGNHYYSHDWDEAKTRVNLRVRGGIGKIDLIASE